MPKSLGTCPSPDRFDFELSLRHPERTTYRTLASGYQYEEWPSRETMAKHVRTNSRVKPVIALEPHEGLGIRHAARQDPLAPLRGASYLDDLGTRSARQYAPVVKKQAAEAGIPLPLPDFDTEVLLDKTIEGLSKEQRIDWAKTPTDRKAVFVNAWAAEMQRQGIRA